MSSWMNDMHRPAGNHSSSRTIVLGIDTGGTFTDLVYIAPNGNAMRWKLLSTPSDPSLAILQGLKELLGDFDSADLEIVHGTTVGTNSFLERKGAKTCLITTRGFEDVIFIGRQNRPSLYDLMVERPEPVVSRENILGVSERTTFDGSVTESPGNEKLQNVIKFCKQQGAESVALCFLHSYANPENEHIAGKALQETGLAVSLSSDILPEFREYERVSTTLLNAYLGPVVGRYCRRLQDALPGAKVFIQQSNGGCRPAADIGRFAVTTLLSGPAAGVAASLRLGRSMGIPRIITLDMGGTSTDVSLCDGKLTYTREYQIEGFPIGLPMIDIHTVGAGGGSIAWIDRGGLLKVGPESAGADPGPVCYGKGKRLTVTDANLFLGRLREDYFLGGRMKLHREQVDLHMRKLAQKLGTTPEEAALGIIRLVNVNMIQAIRAVSLERGMDPRDYALVSFGGAAGLHCLELARELGIKTVIIPAMAGVFSACGMAGSDMIFEGSSGVFLDTSQDITGRLKIAFRKLEHRLKDHARLTDSRQDDFQVERSLDARYKGQSFEIMTPFDGQWQARFHKEHERLYGYRMPSGTPIEITVVRARLKLLRKHTSLIFPKDKNINPETERCRKRYISTEVDILFENGYRRIPVVHRSDMPEAKAIKGPLLIADDFTTLLVLNGWSVTCRSDHIVATGL